MNFLLERFCGNRKRTKGILTVPQTSFAACTLEARDPLYAPTRNKALLALPDGTYRLKPFFHKTRFSLRFMLHGTYHRAHFEDGDDPDALPSGSIILGTGFDDGFRIKDSRETMDMFGKFLELQMISGNFGKMYNDITMTIRHTPDYIYDRLAPSDEELLFQTDYDWNLIGKEGGKNGRTEGWKD